MKKHGIAAPLPIISMGEFSPPWAREVISISIRSRQAFHVIMRVCVCQSKKAAAAKSGKEELEPATRHLVTALENWGEPSKEETKRLDMMR